MRRLSLTRPTDVRNAWLIWAGFALAICVFSSATGHKRTIDAYRQASLNWFKRADLYGEGIHGFLYLPHSAILYAPLAKLPFKVGEVVWRLICIGTFAIGVFRLSKLAGRDPPTELFPLITLLSIPPALSSARNGQMNLPLAALMILTVAALAERKWGQATVWLILGLAAKPLMIVLALLVAALYRPMLGRLLIGLLVLAVLPFFTVSWDYALSQYSMFVQKLWVAAAPSGVRLYADLFGMMQACGIHVALSVQSIVRAGAAVLTLALGWLGLKRWGQIRGAVLLFTLTAVYLMLFNPRTENNTYVFLGPALAVFSAWEFLVDRRMVMGVVLVLMVLLISASYEIASRIRIGPTVWLSPMTCVLFLGYVLLRLHKTKFR